MNKVIFHVDVNSAYLSWSSLKALAEGEETDYRTIPCVVGGDESKRHGVVLAKSLPAKKYGIRTGESLFEARRKCPVLTILRPDFSTYVKMSRAMFRIFEAYTPDVYQYSIDEAFLDMTGMETLLGPPEQAARRLKDEIRDSLGFTVNVGISSNYLLAKMASDFEKPDKVHTLYPREIREKMWPLPVGDLFSVGRSARKKLERHGVRTIGDLAALDRNLLLSEMGVQGGVIWDYANGMETSPSDPAGDQGEKLRQQHHHPGGCGEPGGGLPAAAGPLRERGHPAAAGLHEDQHRIRAGDGLQFQKAFPSEKPGPQHRCDGGDL